MVLMSGIVGGILAVLVCRAWARWVPDVCGRKDASTLLHQNRVAIWVVNGLFFAGVLIALAMYQTGYLSRTDWRGLGVAFGVGSASVFVVLPLFALAGSRSPKEAFVAYAIAQKTPTSVLYCALAAGVAGLVAT